MSIRQSTWIPAALMVMASGLSASFAAEPAGDDGRAHLTPKYKDANGYHLPMTDLTRRIQWGGWCELPGGTGLLFGGMDQGAEDGNPHTQVRQNGAWVSIGQELRTKNPLQKLQEQTWALRIRQKNAAAKARSIYFQGLTAAEESQRIKTELTPMLDALSRDLDKLSADLRTTIMGRKGYEGGQAGLALALTGVAANSEQALLKSAAVSVSAEAIRAMVAVQVALEESSEALDAEPPPRALSPVVFDAKTKLFVIFGGDHLDYLTNDTWVFDPAARKWMQRHPKTAPAPRANHLLAATGDGKVTLTEGFRYADAFYYNAPQYKDVGDGAWTYDVAANEWSGGTGVPADSRTYHSGAFHPDFFLQGPKPNAAENEARLKALPVNTWADMKPPQTLMLNRDWGTAVLDTDRDMILRWSGGHLAHSGTDVPHYHLSCNRWELTHPTELPLGLLYSNTSYPAGRNFNRRPWMVGHTYRCYNYDPVLKKMIFTGRPWIYGGSVTHQDLNYYIYDPDIADWTECGPRPKEMCYADGYFTLTHCATPQGSFVWTKDGKVFRFDTAGKAFSEVKLTGAPLPGTCTDGACLVHDSKRNRLLAIRTTPKQGKYLFEGEVYAIDLKSFEVSALNPAGKAGVTGLEFAREASYDTISDLLLVGTPLPGRSGELPAYDCAGNRWVALKLGGPNPAAGGYGYNVSLGLSYDARRNLHWAVGQYGQIHVLRIDLGATPPVAMENGSK